MYKFEKLKVWQESVALSKICYEVAGTFPAYERSGLSDQLRRAVTSVALNIAEGTGSNTDKDFCRYLYLSRKSLFEVIAILKIAETIHETNKLDKADRKCELVGKLLNGLINKLSANS